MPRQHTLFQALPSTGFSVLIGLGLDQAAWQTDHFFCIIAREALRVLLSVMLASFESSQGCSIDPRQLVECPFHVFLSFWSLWLFLFGAR